MQGSPLAGWDNFYVIVGSSAAALTGLQFVAIAIISDARIRRASTDSIDAFGTPTVVHFSAVLVASAIMTAPWRSVTSAAVAITAFGIAGLVYSLVVVRRARRQTVYQPVLEDWIWHAVLPLHAYVAIAASGLAMPRAAEIALFVLGGCALLLLSIGIHNSWDTVTYVALGESDAEERRP